jgi:predicted O-methyltransferase YrrM
VPAAGFLKYCYLAWFSQPRAERILYRAVRRSKAASIVELGVGNGRRARRLLEVAKRYRPEATPRYTGIDLFEARPREIPGLSIKQAHRTLADCGAKVQLVPGDPLSALARAANALAKTDLVVISADQDMAAFARAWYYLPRMLYERSLVFMEEQNKDGQTAFRLISCSEVGELARQAELRQARRAA